MKNTEDHPGKSTLNNGDTAKVFPSRGEEPILSAGCVSWASGCQLFLAMWHGGFPFSLQLVISHLILFLFFQKASCSWQTILLTLNYSCDRAFRGIVMTRAHRLEGEKKCFSEKVMIEIFIWNDSLDWIHFRLTDFPAQLIFWQPFSDPAEIKWGFIESMTRRKARAWQIEAAEPLSCPLGWSRATGAGQLLTRCCRQLIFQPSKTFIAHSQQQSSWIIKGNTKAIFFFESIYNG